jgi:hypothetical protein
MFLELGKIDMFFKKEFFLRKLKRKICLTKKELTEELKRGINRFC